MKRPKMNAGPCLWCERWVESCREEAGATNPDDPCWASEITNRDGRYVDYGCDESPETTEDGFGSHARPYDLAIRLFRENHLTPRENEGKV